MKTEKLLAGISLLMLIAMLAMSSPTDCPPKLAIGQTYAEIKAGPCPDIEPRARFADSLTASYLCPSQSVVVVGSKYTHRVVAFFLWTGE